MLYGGFLLNVFIKNSIWLTMIMAIYRHLAIVRRINPQQYLKPGYIVIASVLSLIFWICLHLPLLWTWEKTALDCDISGRHFVMSPGKFQLNPSLKQGSIITWAIVGFILPLCILAFCNVKLILTVQASTKRARSSLRPSGSARGASSSSSRQNAHLCMNVTLIAIVTLLFILVFPGEYYISLNVIYTLILSLDLSQCFIVISNGE